MPPRLYHGMDDSNDSDQLCRIIPSVLPADLAIPISSRSPSMIKMLSLRTAPPTEMGFETKKYLSIFETSSWIWLRLCLWMLPVLQPKRGQYKHANSRRNEADTIPPIPTQHLAGTLPPTLTKTKQRTILDNPTDPKQNDSYQANRNAASSSDNIRPTNDIGTQELASCYLDRLSFNLESMRRLDDETKMLAHY